MVYLETRLRFWGQHTLCQATTLPFSYRASLPSRRTVHVNKQATDEQNPRAEAGMRRYRAPLRRQRMFACVQRSILPKTLPAGCALRVSRFSQVLEILPIAALDATLVLGLEPPDFSTDAGNSALIAATKSPQRPVCAFSDTPAAKIKTTMRFQFHHDWFTWEGTPCHGESCLADNS
jgi:hypothetical protein